MLTTEYVVSDDDWSSDNVQFYICHPLVGQSTYFWILISVKMAKLNFVAVNKYHW